MSLDWWFYKLNFQSDQLILMLPSEHVDETEQPTITWTAAQSRPNLRKDVD
jgi:hypothetical protein